jgi:hypothetical protein
MWVPAHTGITGNERADKAAKESLNQNIETRIKVVKSDFTKWVREKSKERRQEEWRNSTNNMATIKPQFHRFKNTEGLPRQQQVAVSRLRKGYSDVTHGYRIRDETRPHCEDCNQEVTVEHLLLQCLVFNGLRQRIAR